MNKPADVIVIGAGPAGIGASVAAARENLNICLVESTGKIGGVIATCPGMPVGAAYPCNKSVGGILDEFVQILYCMKPPAAEIRKCALDEFGPEIVYDHEIAIDALYRMLEDAGVNLLLNTIALEPEMENNRIKSISCYNKSGKTKLRGKVFIDCSGDGDIAAAAGVPYQKGDDSGNMMGVTMTFQMENVNWDRVEQFNKDPYFTDYALKGIASGRLHKDLHKLYIIKGFYNNTAFFNSVTVNKVDGSDPLQVTKATNEARKRCFELAKYINNEVPGFETARLAYIGPGVGIRETRKFTGLYRLRARDLAGAVKFSDGVVACDNPIDDVFRDSNIMTHDPIVEEGEYYTIPFRTMVPKRITNLLFAGRLISADPIAFASVRGMSQCMIMGQACGIAAKQVIERKIRVQNIDTGSLINELIAWGVNGLRGVLL